MRLPYLIIQAISMSSTGHYLIAMWDGGGSVPPLLGVAEKLRSKGQRVTVMGEESMRAEVAAAGADFLPYRHAPSRPNRLPESDPYPDWDGQSPFKVLKKILCGRAEAYAKDVVEACQKQPADWILVDGFLLGVMIGSAAVGIPYIVLWPAIDVVPHPGRPPDGVGLMPGRSFLGEIRDRTLNWIFAKLLGSGRKALNRLNERYGLPPLEHPFDLYQEAEKVLLLSSRHFDYPTRLPANTFYAGPVLNDPAWAEPVKTVPKEPYVLVSLGSTYQNQQALYANLMETLSELPVPVIVTLGNVFDPESFPVYGNIQVFRAGAHSGLLPRCGLVIHHGGHGITLKSILAGLPQLVIPIGRDQLGNAGRVVYHGLGLRASSKASKPQLLEKIKRLLSEESYGQNAQKMARKIREEIEQDLVIGHLSGDQ